MKRLSLVLLLSLALALASGTLRTTAQAPANHVVVISLDGFPAKALDDPYLPVPTLRRLAAAGATAKTMRPVNPTVTWANHTSMVTGVTPAGHGVILNGLLVREPGMPPRVEPWRDKAEMVHARTLYDAVHEAGQTTAQVDWVAIWNAPTITWEFRERPEAGDAIPREMIQAGLISAADVAAFSSKNIVWRDEMWTTAAAFILRQHKPKLMLFHLLNLDSTHHRYGPGTPAGMTAMAHLDAQVGRIVRTVEEAGIADRTTYFVVSDHGFKTVTRQVRLNAALAKAGLIRMAAGKIASADVYAVPEGGSGLVYVTVPDSGGALLAKAKQALAGIEGVDRIVEPSEFARLGLPLPSTSDQMGALFVTAKEGYAIVADPAEPVAVGTGATSLGAHGYISTDPDIQAIFIASGAAVRAGGALDRVDNLDIAPTAARILGVRMTNLQGRVLDEILKR